VLYKKIGEVLSKEGSCRSFGLKCIAASERFHPTGSKADAKACN